MLAYILAIVVLLVAALVAFGIAALLGLHGTQYLIFVLLILLLGIAAAVVILVLHFRAKKEKEREGEPAGPGATGDLDLMLTDANRKLRISQQGAKTLEAMPLVYILGDSGTAKTTTVTKSGLNPELLAGTAAPVGDQIPTEVLNLWFTQVAALVEVGASVRRSNALLARLLQRTRAAAYRSAFGTGAAPRAVVVCLSAEQLLVADGGQSLLASARVTGAQLREISRMLGMPVPVYVIVTKLDRVPHFDQYVRNLSEAEARQILGEPLPRSEASVGTYADQTSRTLAGVIDALAYKLGEFRVEMLARETEPANAPGVYEFPREFGKLRKNLNQYLVELCKPSQLSANPYLRGFYLTGVRAHIVERMINAPAAAERSAPQDAGATQYLNIDRAAHARAASPAPVMTSSRVPQWTFLARLFPEVILGDRSALSATRQTAPARRFRRILFGSLAILFFLSTIFLVVSFLNNSALERRIQADARALPSQGASSISVPSLSDLRTLDDLRQIIVLLDGYRQNGVPLGYTFGLYQGDKLDADARRGYFDRFQPMMLNPAQTGFVNFMRELPDAPATSSDFNSYRDAYNPLKAYLITTTHSEKDQPQWLTPVFYKYWLGARQVDSEQQQLAQKQIDFYGAELLSKPPYSIQPNGLLVDHTRVYLSKFRDETRVYQAMLTDADKNNPPVDFNRTYPDAVKFVSNPHVVRGAFSKNGFAFMQDALQHADRYVQGEEWVLGNKSGQSFDTATISHNLVTQYTADFLKEWHTFMTSAHVASCGPPIQQAPPLLHALSSPSSPILELFFTASHNTAVNDTTIKNTYQPTQVLVDPNATDRLIGGANAPYIAALTNLSGAVDLGVTQPNIMTDAPTFAPIQQQVVQADGAVGVVSQAFNVDKDTYTEKVVIDLMKNPIDCVGMLAPSPSQEANRVGAGACKTISPLLSKFPFTTDVNAPQASLVEVESVFAPGTGAFASAFSGGLNKVLVQQGAPYAAVPNPPGPVNKRFVDYFNRAARITSTLYPNGQKTASFTFSLQFIPGNGVSSATLVVDAQRISGLSPQQFTWIGPGAQKTTLVYDNNEAFSYQGTWSLFQMVRSANKISGTPGGYRLDYAITTTIAGHVTETGKIVSFELSGPGADLLAGEGFSRLGCVTPVILKQ